MIEAIAEWLAKTGMARSSLRSIETALRRVASKKLAASLSAVRSG
ncbi:MAG: hypothetical protein ACRESU_04985 [Gammaproteobacteria bacterium]